MARKYDIAVRIANANQKPIIAIDEEHEYKINNSKSAAIMIQAMGDEAEEKGMKFLDEIVIIALGKEAHEYIESLNMSVPAYQEIVKTIMASMQDISLEEFENLEEEAKNRGKK